jgi:hypothetical protein
VSAREGATWSARLNAWTLYLRSRVTRAKHAHTLTALADVFAAHRAIVAQHRCPICGLP